MIFIKKGIMKIYKIITICGWPIIWNAWNRNRLIFIICYNFSCILFICNFFKLNIIWIFCIIFFFLILICLSFSNCFIISNFFLYAKINRDERRRMQQNSKFDEKLPYSNTRRKLVWKIYQKKLVIMKHLL